MASPSSSYATFSINKYYQEIFDPQQEEEENAEPEPHLFLCLRSEVDVRGEIIMELDVTSHRFDKCDFSFLNAFIAEHEPLPTDILMDDAGRERERISREIIRMVSGCVGVAGIRGLLADIVYRVYEEREDQDDDVVVLRERRMGSMQRNVDCSAAKVEDCAVCLEEMGGGEEEVVRTPCDHQFHARCVERWFEESGFCPLCRFRVDK